MTKEQRTVFLHLQRYEYGAASLPCECGSTLTLVDPNSPGDKPAMINTKGGIEVCLDGDMWLACNGCDYAVDLGDLLGLERPSDDFYAEHAPA